MAAMNPPTIMGKHVSAGGFFGVTGVQCLPRFPRGRPPN